MTADVRFFSAFVDICTRDVVCHEAETSVAVTRRTVGGDEAPLAAFFLAALVDLAERSFVSAVATILPAVAHLRRKKTLSVQAREAALVDVATRRCRGSGGVCSSMTVQFIGSICTVFRFIAAPMVRDALVIVTAVAGAVARVAVHLVGRVVAVCFPVAHPYFGDAVAAVAAGEFVRGTSVGVLTASGLVLVVTAVVLAITPPEHGDTPVVAAVKPALLALAGRVAHQIQSNCCQHNARDRLHTATGTSAP